MGDNLTSSVGLFKLLFVAAASLLVAIALYHYYNYYYNYYYYYMEYAMLEVDFV